jgi:hypothetical protein
LLSFVSVLGVVLSNSMAVFTTAELTVGKPRHQQPTRLNPKRTDSSDEPIQGAEIWRTLPRTVEDQ